MKSKMSDSHLLIFLRLLEAFMHISPHIVGAVKLVIQQQPYHGRQPKIRESVQKLLNNLENGQSFTQAAKNLFHRHPTLYYIILSGEKSNTLHKSLQSAKTYLNWRISTRKNLLGSLLYPVFLGVIFWLLIWGFFYAMAPELIKLQPQNFTDSYTPWISNIVSHYPFLSFSFPFIISTLVFSGFKIARPHKRTDRLIFLKTLHTLLKSGYYPPNAIAVLREELKITTHHNDSLPIINFLSKIGLKPEDLTLIEAGEKSNKLEDALKQLVTIYEEQRKTRARFIAQFIAPLCILAIGSVVMWMLATFILPLYTDLVTQGL